VFCTSLGGPRYASDVRTEFKRITEKAGLGRDWTPRELRHTFVSLLSDSGVPIEQVADAVAHASTRTTEVVYRHSGRLRVPPRSRWARSARAEQRQTEAKLTVRLPVRLPRPLINRIVRLMSSGNSRD
jgi:integrase